MSFEEQASLDTLEKALGTLLEALAMPKTPVVRDACIQRFEYTYELAWKTIRRFALHQGLTENSPVGSIKTAFRLGWIEDQRIWLEMKDDRNLTTHTYDEGTAEKIYMSLPLYAAALTKLVSRLRESDAG